MEKGEYTLNVVNGVINISPPALEYYKIAEHIANDLTEPCTTKWNEICLLIINILDKQAINIKSKIVTNMTYVYKQHHITYNDVIFNNYAEAKSYVEGYNAAVDNFKETFSELEEQLIKTLEKILPTITQSKI